MKFYFSFIFIVSVHISNAQLSEYVVKLSGDTIKKIDHFNPESSSVWVLMNGNSRELLAE